MEMRKSQTFSVIATFLLACLWVPVAYCENQKLLIIDSQAGDPYETVRTSLLDTLKSLGYTEENGFISEYYSLSHYHGAAKSLWQHRIQKVKYDAIFLNGTLAVNSFKEIAWKSPDYSFIFASVTDPVGLGLVEDYEKLPIGNFTGISFHVPVDVRLSFVRKLIPDVTNIGMVYADMPQSHSYKNWLEDLTKEKAWQNVTFHFRKVGFIPSDGGHHRMAQISKQHIIALDSLVDVFLSPHDQMGAQSPFAKIVAKSASKPLIGLGRNDVVDGWGAMASIYPDQTAVGQQAAYMIDRVLKGEKIKDIVPEMPVKYGMVIDQALTKKYKLTISQELKNTAEIIN